MHKLAASGVIDNDSIQTKTIEMTQTATMTEDVTLVQTATTTDYATVTDVVTMTELSTVIQPTTYVSVWVSTSVIDNVSFLSFRISLPRRLTFYSCFADQDGGDDPDSHRDGSNDAHSDLLVHGDGDFDCHGDDDGDGDCKRDFAVELLDVLQEQLLVDPPGDHDDGWLLQHRDELVYCQLCELHHSCPGIRLFGLLQALAVKRPYPIRLTSFFFLPFLWCYFLSLDSRRHYIARTSELIYI
jgi:hypothetical protein